MGWHSTNLGEYLFIFSDILIKPDKTLLHLRNISLDLEVQSRDLYFICLDSVYKDGILSASLRDSDTPGTVEMVKGDGCEDEQYID
jgi:hypothetical protein